jgi:hypothetical protein
MAIRLGVRCPGLREASGAERFFAPQDEAIGPARKGDRGTAATRLAARAH